MYAKFLVKADKVSQSLESFTLNFRHNPSRFRYALVFASGLSLLRMVLINSFFLFGYVFTEAYFKNMPIDFHFSLRTSIFDFPSIFA